MRFADPIKDHGFVFPDVAEFPDVAHEQCFEDTNQSEVLLNDLKEAHKLKVSKDEFVEKLNALIDYTDSQMPIKDDEKQYIRSYRKRIGKLYDYYKTAGKTLGNIDSAMGDDICQHLYQHGWWSCNADDIAREVMPLVEPQINELLSKPDWTTPVGVYDRALPDYKAHWTVKEKLNNWCSTSLINRGVVQYFRKQAASVEKATLHISKATDTHLYHCYQDCTTTPITTNLHIDPTQGLCKALLYLTDVKEDDGPIWFVDTSNRWQHNIFEDTIARGISVGCYLHNPSARRAVFRLPKEIRKSYLFGRNLLDGSDQQKVVLDKAVKITSKEKGNFCLFDAGNLMHTGGWPKPGHYRINLQIQIKVW